MRKHYSRILKNFFYESLIHTRHDLGITQEEMAFRLSMACLTYIDLDHGKTGCSAVTLALYLVYLCKDPLAFIIGLRNAFEEGLDDVA